MKEESEQEKESIRKTGIKYSYGFLILCDPLVRNKKELVVEAMLLKN